ncbi:MAG: DUF4185 domain-containing protein [Spirochaetes bacterium]|nr:DUF4185 domain-containing protein [Spirochaetota bacterium]
MKKIITISSIIFIFLACGGAEDLGIFGESRKTEVLGQDGVTPIPVSGSVYMWTFGDTVLGRWKADAGQNALFEESAEISEMISNSLAFTETPTALNIKNLKFIFLKKNGKVCQFINYRKGENPKSTRLWPVDGVKIGGKIYVYYYIIKSDDKNVPFYLSAVGLALWAIPDGWRTGDYADFTRLGDLFPRNYPAFGAGVLQKDGYVYTAGHFNSKDKTSPVKIGRVKTEDIETANKYEFLAEDGTWSGDINRAGSFLGDVMGECSLSYNEFIKKFMLVYCQSWTGKIIIVKFDDFSGLRNAEKMVVFEAPVLPVKKTGMPKFYYSGKEIFSSGSSVFAIYINPLEYQPRLLKIDLGFDFLSQ